MSVNDKSGNRREFLMSASSGLLSGFLYLSYVLSFAFIVPVQHSYSRNGRKSGLLATAFALLTISMGQIGRMFELRDFSLVSLLAGVVPPVAFIVALGFINLPVPRVSRIARIAISVVVLSAIAFPLMLRVTSDTEFLTTLETYLVATMESAGLGAEGAAYARETVSSAVQIVKSAFIPFILWIIVSNWWLGSVIAARAGAGSGSGAGIKTAALKLSSLKVPGFLLWPTLITWASLFAVIVSGQNGVLASLTWNIALCLASFYAVQGMGILSHLAERINAGRILRLLVPLAVLLVLVSTTAGTIILIALPLLGITEVWIPYRNLKGAMK